MQIVMEQVSNELWNDKNNQEEFMEYLKVQVRVQQMEDWYQVFILEKNHIKKELGYRRRF